MNIQNNQHRNIKFRQDSLIMKCKSILINELLFFINEKIKEIYKNEIGHKLLLCN